MRNKEKEQGGGGTSSAHALEPRRQRPSLIPDLVLFRVVLQLLLHLHAPPVAPAAALHVQDPLLVRGPPPALQAVLTQPRGLHPTRRPLVAAAAAAPRLLVPSLLLVLLVLPLHQRNNRRAAQIATHPSLSLSFPLPRFGCGRTSNTPGADMIRFLFENDKDIFEVAWRRHRGFLVRACVCMSPVVVDPSPVEGRRWKNKKEEIQKQKGTVPKRAVHRRGIRFVFIVFPHGAHWPPASPRHCALAFLLWLPLESTNLREEEEEGGGGEEHVERKGRGWKDNRPQKKFLFSNFGDPSSLSDCGVVAQQA